MIPHCKQNGCQVAKSGRPPCSKGCALERDEPLRLNRHTPPKPVPEPVAPKPVPEPPPTLLVKASPEPARKPRQKHADGPRVHLGTGTFVTRKTIPNWRPKPAGPEPWEKGSCGVITSGSTTRDPNKVTCQVCLRKIEASQM